MRIIAVFGVVIFFFQTLISPAKLEVPDHFEAFYVNDFAGIVSAADAERMLDIGAYVAEKTTAEIVLVTVPSLNGMDIEDAAHDYFTSWRLGNTEDDNGVLLLFSVNERMIYVMLGKAIETKLPTSMIGGYIDEYFPYFSNDSLSMGLYLLYKRISNNVASIYEIAIPENPYGAE